MNISTETTLYFIHPLHVSIIIKHFLFFVSGHIIICTSVDSCARRAQQPATCLVVQHTCSACRPSLRVPTGPQLHPGLWKGNARHSRLSQTGMLNKHLLPHQTNCKKNQNVDKKADAKERNTTSILVAALLGSLDVSLRAAIHYLQDKRLHLFCKGKDKT